MMILCSWLPAFSQASQKKIAGNMFWEKKIVKWKIHLLWIYFLTLLPKPTLNSDTIFGQKDTFFQLSVFIK